MNEYQRNGLYIGWDGTKRWYRNDTYHRIGGPAVECSNGTNEYWLYNDEYSEEEYNKAMSNMPLLYWNRFKKGEWL